MPKREVSKAAEVEQALIKRADEIREAADAVMPLFREEEMLKASVRFYEQQGHADHPFASEVKKRHASLTLQVNERLLAYEEFQTISRLLRYYERARSQDVIEHQSHLHVMRQQLSYRLDVERRDLARERAAAGPSGEGRIVDALSARASAGTPKEVEVAAAPADAPNVDGRRELRPDVLQLMGRRAREYVDLTHGPISFMDLYGSVRELAREAWPQSNPRARMENFRYWLRQAGASFGLRYDQGKVSRAAVKGGG